MPDQTVGEAGADGAAMRLNAIAPGSLQFASIRTRAMMYQWFFRYGISPEQYQFMYEAQQGLCALCGNPQISGKRLCVDHCHRTGVIRGLLCMHCNRALGRLGDSVESIQYVLEYLQNPPVLPEGRKPRFEPYPEPVSGDPR